MANIKSALKHIRSSAKRRERNRFYLSTTRTFIKKARRSIEQGNLEEAQAAIKQASSYLEKSAEKGIIHKNNAARRKSRLMRLLNRASAGQPTA